MRFTMRQIAGYAIAALAGLSAVAPSASAQSTFHPSFYGSTELDTRDSQFYLLGVYVGVGGLGWSPYVNANAYQLNYSTQAIPNAIDKTLRALSPTVGVAYAARTGGVSLGVGYAWVDNEDPGAPGAEAGGSNGLTTSLGAYRLGSRRRSLRTQLLSNYNWGSRYLWVRGRGSVPLGRSESHPTRIGAEVVGQGGGKGNSKSNTFQLGPTLEYAWTPSFRTTGAAGYKSVGGPSFTERESGAYFKLEFSYSP